MKSYQIAYAFKNQYALPIVYFYPLWVIYNIANYLIFFNKKNQKSFYLKSRSKWLIFLSAIGQFFIITVCSARIVIGESTFPNLFSHLLLWLFIPLHIMPYPFRALNFICDYYIAQQDEGSPPSIWKFLLEHHKWVSHTAFTIYFLICMLAITVWCTYSAVTTEELHWGQVGDGFSLSFYKISTVCFSLCTLLLWIAAFILKNIHDEIKVNSEFISIAIVWTIFIPVFIISGLHFVSESRECFLVTDYFLSFVCVYDFVVSFCYPISLALVQKEEVNLGVDVLDRFDLLLSDKTASTLFYNFLNKRLCAENYRFLRAVERFRTSIEDDFLRQDYKIICNNFIKDSAPYKVNIRIETAKTILKCDRITPEVFNNAYKEVYTLIKQDQYNEFKNSDEAIEYATELYSRALQSRPDCD